MPGLAAARSWFYTLEMPGRVGTAGLGSSHVIRSEPEEQTAIGVPEFTVDVFENEYLPAGAGEVNAVVTVTCADCADDEPAAAVNAAEIIIVGRSGSMNAPGARSPKPALLPRPRWI